MCLEAYSELHQNNHDIIEQISSKRIIKYIYDTFSGKKIDFKKMITASDIMTPDLIIIDPKDKFDSAKAIMRRDLIDHLPVAERHSDGKIMIKGMITSNHIMQTLIPAESIGRRSLGTEDDLKSEQEVIGIADKNVITVDPDDTIMSTIDTLFKANSTYTIVQSLDNILGIITYRDIISLLGDQIQSDVPIYIIGMPEEPFEAELVRSKFVNIVKHLSRMSPKIEEARCKIKISDIEGERIRYEGTLLDHRLNVSVDSYQYEITGSDNWKLPTFSPTQPCT